MNEFTNNTPAKNRNLAKTFEYVIFEYENSEYHDTDDTERYEYCLRSLKEIKLIGS